MILSDMGRVLFSIVEDSTGGAHDALAGGSTAATNAARYHVDDPSQHARQFHSRRRQTRASTAAMFMPCISFFAPVSVDADGRFQWEPSRRQAGDFIDLRAEMDLLVALSNCPHPLDPSPTYAPGARRSCAIAPDSCRSDDLCRTASAEAARGFENNALLANSGAEG